MERIEEMFKTLTNQINKMDAKLQPMSTEILFSRQENLVLQEKICKQEERMQNLEREIRTKNLIIKGVPDEEQEQDEITKANTNKLLQNLGVEINIQEDADDIRRIGNYRQSSTRPILIKLTKEKKKYEILTKTAKLKGSDIWIDEESQKK